VPRQGQVISINELTQFLSGKFAKFWIPDGYAIIDAIPKTSVGKFSKSALREKYILENTATSNGKDSNSRV
jgi:fatty-acyl-CoA synthase